MDAPFPTDEAQFTSDERISFSRLDNKYIAVRDDGAEFEFDAAGKQWVPTDDDDEVLNAVDDINGVPSLSDTDSAGLRRRREDGDDGAEDSGPPKRARPAKKQKKPPQPRQNTAVYVTGLPQDVTVEEVHDIFSRKAGVIAEEIDSGAPRIKLYEDDKGNFKGDALVVFFKPQSVEMAIMLLDDTDFRITPSGNRDGRIRVQAADSSYKKTQYDQENGDKSNNNGNSNNGGTSGGAGPVERKPQQKDRDRQKIIKKTQKLDAKLADWDDDDPYAAARMEAPSKKKDKTVILRHMFTLEELEEDPAALLEIKEDIRDECAKLGQVTNVVLYDQEEDGFVSVKFADAASAQACIKLMHGRSFDGRTVEAALATGGERFKKSKKAQPDEEDSD